MKKDFRCELTVNEPAKFLEICGIQKNTLNQAELRRVDWIWDHRPETKPYAKYGVYFGMMVLVTVSGQVPHSTLLVVSSAIVGILTLELLDRSRRKKLSRWSQAYGNGIQRLLRSRGEDETSAGEVCENG